MKIKQKKIKAYFFLLLCFVTFYGQFINAQRVGAKIKIPATLLIKENKNAFSIEENKFEFNGALFSNCNPLNCHELSNILARIPNMTPLLYGSTQDLQLSLKGQIGETKLSNSLKSVGEFNQDEVYKTLPWNLKLQVNGNLTNLKLSPQSTYSGNSVIQFILF